MKRANMKGFTLIELIIVIIIIGILAGIAIPRFINQTTNARIAAMNGMAGAINSAAMLAQAEYRAEGNSSASAATTATMDGTAVTVVAGSGFPAGSAAGIGTAIRSTQGFTPTYGATTTYDFTTAVTNCNVSYVAATGVVTVTTTGC